MRVATTTAAGPVGHRCSVARSRPQKSNHSHNKWRDCRGPVTTLDYTGTPTATNAAFSPWGEGTPLDTSAGNADLAYHGASGITTDHTPGLAPVTDMGARPYRPDLARFLTIDPVVGGCANDYAYVHGDPVNTNDISGKGTWDPRTWIREGVEAVQQGAKWLRDTICDSPPLREAANLLGFFGRGDNSAAGVAVNAASGPGVGLLLRYLDSFRGRDIVSAVAYARPYARASIAATVVATSYNLGCRL